MAPLVHDETADCKRENKGRREGRRDVERGQGREREKEMVRPGLHNA